MNFGEAFIKMKEGYIIRRDFWSKGDHLGNTKESVEGGIRTLPYLYRQSNGVFVPYSLDNRDLFAEDWEIAQ